MLGNGAFLPIHVPLSPSLSSHPSPHNTGRMDANRKIRLQWPRPENRFWHSILLLVGHLGAGPLVFTTIFTFGWGVSFLFDYLNAIRHFSPEMFKLVAKLEIGLFYFDTVVGGLVLLISVFRFLRNVLEGK